MSFKLEINLNMKKDIRWKQRFANFEKALKKLNMAIEAHKQDENNELYQMALIQAFEFTYELGWKTIKDYLNYHGLTKATMPRQVIKEGFRHNLIEDGQTWINMLEHRNLMSHTYEEKRANEAAYQISYVYIKAIDQVYNFFKEEFK